MQGCHFHCYNCFNSETWDFDGGKEWTQETKDIFLMLIDRPYIKRISILGGEPLENENIEDVLDLVTLVKKKHPDKMIWLYSGGTWESLMNINPYETRQNKMCEIRKNIISQCDVFVDGKYIDSKRSYSLKWRGSSNQRIIDVQKTLNNQKNNNGGVVLYCE